MPIKRPIVSEIGNGVYLVDEYGLCCMFIVCGTEKSLVIDTGMGYCDFRKIVEEITTLPYAVACTHGSIDHTGGWDQFEEVHLHPADVERARAVAGMAERKMKDGDDLRGMWGDSDVWEYSHDSVRRWEKPEPRLKELCDGFEFNLGGRTVTTLYTPAHSPGHCSFIDDGSRILFSGDCCNTNLGVSAGYVSQALRSLRNIERHKSEFDRNFNGHVGYAADVTAISLPDTVLEDGIAACSSVLDGSARLLHWRNHFGNREMVTSTIYGSVRLNFNPERIFEPGSGSDGNEN